jgi:membrane associated rhomboid family serine protease
VVDFRNTGIPVFRCRECGGLLASRDAVDDLACTFGFHRKNAALYDALGTALAEELRQRLDRRYGPDAGKGLAGGVVPCPGLPLVVPLADSGGTPASLPMVTRGLLGLIVAFHIFSGIGIGGMDGLASRLALPSGVGLGHAPGFVVWLAPFFHDGIVPLATGCLFLHVLGDNVEDRLGHATFFLFYLVAGAAAGTAHLLWGKAGAPAVLGSAGAVAGVLGAYLVFFPQVPISMYGAGRVVAVPAYLFACAWAVAQFLWTPYSLAGNLAGFAAGAAGAALKRSIEGRSP